MRVPDPLIENEESDAANLSEAIILANSLKLTVNESIRKVNELLSSLRKT